MIVTPHRARVLNRLSGWRTTGDLANACGWGTSRVRSILEGLLGHGAVKRRKAKHEYDGSKLPTWEWQVTIDPPSEKGWEA